ncbi:MAG: PQQ-dependent sugar dehydrogenase [Gammaproteobacteria bacterium]|nr:PQQ-dependent sugar dehydrogenase [Gammaproteobacteria bacterium]MCW8988781.1 PQQ-dependent sugar dehydrogenase [Gammaproteobacteria bacterium]
MKLEQVFTVPGIPWGMAFVSPSELIITEREGIIRLINLKSSTNIKLKNTPEVLADGQGGMLDVAIPPDYKTSKWIYFTYVKDSNKQGVTVLARAKLNKDRLTQWQELLVSKSGTPTSYHFGSRIAFDDQGHVYFGIGDRGERPIAQDLTNHAGTIMRLNLDGSIPEDNPFKNNPAALPEIWSYGHRNPQGLSFDLKHKRLWEIEHGPRGGDELNRILPGKNYGWPVISYGKEYWGPVAVGEGTHKTGMQQPVKIYIPSIAPGSLIVYSGNAFPEWKANLFAGALKLKHINRIVLNENGKAIKEERLLESLDERIRALTQSPEGWIYFSTDSGIIYRLRPKQ